MILNGNIIDGIGNVVDTDNIVEYNGDEYIVLHVGEGGSLLLRGHGWNRPMDRQTVAVWADECCVIG